MIAAKFGSSLPSWEQSIIDGDRAMDNVADETVHLEDSHDDLISKNSYVGNRSVEREEPTIEVELEIEDSDFVEKSQDLEEEIRRALTDTAEEDEEEFRLIEMDFEDGIFSLSSRIISTSGQHSTTFVMSSPLRGTCIAHTLQLVIKDGLKAMHVIYSLFSRVEFNNCQNQFSLQGQISKTIEHASKIVNSVRKSGKDTEVILNSVKFRLPAMNATRWNSQYYMLKKLYQAFDQDNNLQNNLSATIKHGRLSALELKIIKEIITILEIFEEASDDFQADYETVGNVVPAYLDLLAKVSMTTVNMDENSLCGKIQYCKPVTTALRDSLISRLSYVLHDSTYVIGTYKINR